MYSVEKNVQIIIALMKAHGIKRVVVSPGSTNVCLVYSLQNDSYFELFSSVDERSAAYLACGMATETGKPVAITCTEATASRNYMPGLTEAFYRKLPILAITSTNETTHVGQNYPQMIDRSVLPNDVAKMSVQIPFLSGDSKKMRGYVNLLNDAMAELTRCGGGPVHIEYETHYSTDYSVRKLPDINVTRRITEHDTFPQIVEGKIAIYVGAHRRWPDNLVKAVDAFCEKYDAVVLCDQITNYTGKYGVYHTLLTSQLQNQYPFAVFDTMIYIGEVSSAYEKKIKIKNVWRVSPDGEFRNILQKFGGKLQFVFEMEEEKFFSYYTEKKIENSGTGFVQEWRANLSEVRALIPELPFSNLWIAQKMSPRLPHNSRLYLSIENTLRSWNYFETDKTIEGYSNTGGFGIDGGMSTMMGAAMANPDKLFFFVTGDLAFFYDMNVMGNRHVGNNVRIMLINNGIGQQFKNPGYAAQYVGDQVDSFIAAAGHYGNKSVSLVKHFSEDLGYEYLSAFNKDEFLTNVERFINGGLDKRMVFEVFTSTEDETEALRIIQGLVVSTTALCRSAIRTVIGEKGVKIVKKLIKK